MERPLIRQGVPVLNRSTWKPSLLRESDTVEVASPMRPPFSFFIPTCISPRMNVPAERTTVWALICIWSEVVMPMIVSFSTRSSATLAWWRSIPGVDSRVCLMRNW